MESIIVALQNNQNLEEDIKHGRILPVLKKFIKNFGDIFSLDNEYIAKKIETLTLSKMPKFGEFDETKVKNNEVLIEPSALKKRDIDNITLQALLKYLYPNNSVGLDALYNGTVQMIANACVGESNISDEFVMCDILSKVIEPDVMNQPEPLMTSFFEGNIASCLVKLQDKGVSKEEITNLMSIANQNYMTTKVRTKSNLGTMEKMLIDFKFRQSPTKEELYAFTESLRIDSQLYGAINKQYTDLDNLGVEYQRMVQEYFINKTSKQR